MLHLLHGPDTFRSRARLVELRTALDPDGFNGVSLEAQDFTLDRLRACCDTLPFFGTGRCVDVQGGLTRWRDRAKAVRSGEAARGADEHDPFDALAGYLPQMPPTTTLVLWEPGAYELPAKLRQAVQDLGAAAVIERFDPPYGRELQHWAMEQAEVAGATMRPDAAAALLDALCPAGWQEPPRRRDVPVPDLYRIESEVQKLATAALSREPAVITARYVAALTVDEAATNVFRLVDAAAAGDSRRALTLLQQGLAEGLAPEYILSLLAARFSLLVRLRAVGGGHNADATAKQLGLTPYRVREAARQLTQLGADQLDHCLQIVLDADLALKSGRATRGDDALYWVVLELCHLGAAVPIVPADR